MVRFGRTVGSQLVDALSQRLGGGTSSHVTVGEINLTGAPDGDPEAEDPFGLPEWAKQIRREEAAQTLNADDLLLRSAFHLLSGGGEDAGEDPAFTAWGRVATGGLEPTVDDVTMDGGGTTGLIGFDSEWERLLAGVMLSQSTGEGGYRLDPAKGDDAGTVESSLTGVTPTRGSNSMRRFRPGRSQEWARGSSRCIGRAGTPGRPTSRCAWARSG